MTSGAVTETGRQASRVPEIPNPFFGRGAEMDPFRPFVHDAGRRVRDMDAQSVVRRQTGKTVSSA